MTIVAWIVLSALMVGVVLWLIFRGSGREASKARNEGIRQGEVR